MTSVSMILNNEDLILFFFLRRVSHDSNYIWSECAIFYMRDTSFRENLTSTVS